MLESSHKQPFDLSLSEQSPITTVPGELPLAYTVGLKQEGVEIAQRSNLYVPPSCRVEAVKGDTQNDTAFR